MCCASPFRRRHCRGNSLRRRPPASARARDGPATLRHAVALPIGGLGGVSLGTTELVNVVMKAPYECLVSGVWMNYFICWYDAEFERYEIKLRRNGQLSLFFQWSELRASFNIHGKEPSTIFKWTSRNKKAQIFWSALMFDKLFGKNFPILGLAYHFLMQSISKPHNQHTPNATFGVMLYSTNQHMQQRHVRQHTHYLPRN